MCILVDSGSIFKKDADTVWSKYLVVDIGDLLDDDNLVQCHHFNYYLLSYYLKCYLQFEV